MVICPVTACEYYQDREVEVEGADGTIWYLTLRRCSHSEQHLFFARYCTPPFCRGCVALDRNGAFHEIPDQATIDEINADWREKHWPVLRNGGL